MFVSPMLLQYAKDNEPFNSPNHIAELKLDGIRLIVSNLDKIKIYTRHHNDVTSKFPELHDAPISSGTILDGELIVTDKDGKPSFEDMMTRFQSNKDRTLVTFCAFDIIRYKGIDVTGLPLLKRKELLDRSYKDTDSYKKVSQVKGSALEYYEAVKRYGLEGIIIKDTRSKYEVGARSSAWQKVINWTYVEVFIVGYRKNDFGWLTAIKDIDGNFRATGIIEFGVTPEHKKAFNSVRHRLVYKEDDKLVYMEPLIQVRVKTRNWTKNSMLRSPVFVEFIL